MIKQCLFCGKDFEAIRPTANYCSGRCKMAFIRSKRGKTSVTEAPSQSQNVTPGGQNEGLEAVSGTNQAENSPEIGQNVTLEGQKQPKSLSKPTFTTGGQTEIAQQKIGDTKPDGRVAKASKEDGQLIWVKPCGGCQSIEDMGEGFCICYRCLAKGMSHQSLGLTCHFKGIEWEQYREGTNYQLSDTLAKQDQNALLHDTVKAREIVENGLPVPKWKRNYATREEAIQALHQVMADLGMKKDSRGIYTSQGDQEDYSQWK